MKTRHGFTLIEMLVGMAILGILMLAFTQLFGSSLRASGEISSRNELISEGQIAQQLISSRLQNAHYIYPPGSTLQLTPGGGTTRNTVRSGAGQNWTVGTDPFVAMLLPPLTTGVCDSVNTNACFTFYAYYPMIRSSLISAAEASAPDADINNANAWVMMEYRANINDSVDRRNNQLASPPLPGTTYGTAYSGNRTGRMLVDYVQPTTTTPTYTMVSVDTSSRFVDVNLRLLQNRNGDALRIPAGDAPFASPTPTLSTRIYPRNWN